MSLKCQIPPSDFFHVAQKRFEGRKAINTYNFFVPERDKILNTSYAVIKIR